MAVSEESNTEQFDLVIIGSGEGSKLAAWDFARQGQRVAVIERRYLGGACPNIACLPSKNVIYTAQVAGFAKKLADFGMSAEHFNVNMAGVRERKRQMVAKQVQAHLDLFHASGAELILGTGRFVNANTVEVALSSGGTRNVQGKRILIGTGSRAVVGDTPGLREADPLTHVEALELDTVPGHLIILGGGYVGLEFAHAMRRFGSAVTVVEHNGRLLHQEDQDVSDEIEALFKEEGIDVSLNSRLVRVDGRSGDGVKLTMERNGTTETLEGTHILVAAGRRPNTEELGLEQAGVETTHDGYIRVNERLETTAPGVWAVGDVAGSPKFTHVSKDDYRVFRAQVLGGPRVTTGRLVPYCLFLEPELAKVGLGEREAKSKGLGYRLFKVPMAAVLRAQAVVETRGFMKALVAEDDTILGFTSFGMHAGEVMAAVQLVMLARQPYTAILDAIIAHPTMAEGLQMLFGSDPLKSSAH
jgi:pyruvate/2-oxoglutarate dehydrogenase complex dihydrolipoamide dehydrogenase (E3) component